MATIRKQWLKLSKENYPTWWQPGQIVRVQQYGKEKAFILMPTTDQRRAPGYSKLTIKNQLSFYKFIDGDYKIVPHDGDAIVIYPVKAEDAESGTNKSDDIDERKAKLDIDPSNCNVNQILIWAKQQAINAVGDGRIPSSLVQTLQFVIDTTERIEKTATKQLGKADESNKESLLELIQDTSIPPEVRAKLQMQYDKQYGHADKDRKIRNTIILDTGEIDADSSR